MINKNFFYFVSCILLVFFLSGCREKKIQITVFENLPDSPVLTEVKSSLENKKPIAVAFLAEWCPHCRKYKPVFLEAKDAFGENVTFINIDVDDPNASGILSRFQVRGIPTSAFIRSDGSVFKLHVGGIEKDDLIGIIEDLIKSKRKKRGEPIAPFPIEPVEEKKQVEEQPPQEIIEEKETSPAEEQIKEEQVPEPQEEITPSPTPAPVEEAVEGESEEGRPEGGRPLPAE